MAESAYTKGPWRLSEPDPFFGDYTIQGAHEELAVAAVVNSEMRRMGGRSGEHAANAVLIAAAPDLVEALELAAMQLHAKADPSLADKLAMAKCAAALSRALGKEG